MFENPNRIRVGPDLGRLVGGIETDFSLPPPEVPHAVRRRLQAALLSSGLYLDCARLLFSQLVSEPEAGFLYSDPLERYTLQLFCWPPGFGNEPHLHTNWNVSSVMAGSLLVFRSAISGADCLASEPLPANAGQAGLLIPPQFHCLGNAGSEPAITFHVFSLDQAGSDRNHLERSPASMARVDDDGILAIATVAAKLGGRSAIDIVDSAFVAAGNSAKLELMKLMLRLDPQEAIRLGKTLSRLVGGLDGRRLLNAVEKVEAATRQGG